MVGCKIWDQVPTLLTIASPKHPGRLLQFRPIFTSPWTIDTLTRTRLTGLSTCSGREWGSWCGNDSTLSEPGADMGHPPRLRVKWPRLWELQLTRSEEEIQYKLTVEYSCFDSSLTGCFPFLKYGYRVGRARNPSWSVQWRTGEEEAPPLLALTLSSQPFQVPQFPQRHSPERKNEIMQT